MLAKKVVIQWHKLSQRTSFAFVSMLLTACRPTILADGLITCFSGFGHEPLRINILPAAK